MNMVLRLLLMVVVIRTVANQLTLNSHLYTKCEVSTNGVRTTTFGNSLKFWFVRTKDDDLKLCVNGECLVYPNIPKHKWIQAELKLESELLILGKLKKANRTNSVKNVVFSNVDVLLDCPEGWPNKEISNDSMTDLRIPISGKEELLVLTPMQDTYVKFSVSEDKRTICLDHHSRVIVTSKVDGDDGQCNFLKKNSTVVLKVIDEGYEIKILDVVDHELDNISYNKIPKFKFLREGLQGPLYIAQYIGGNNKTADIIKCSNGSITDKTTIGSNTDIVKYIGNTICSTTGIVKLKYFIPFIIILVITIVLFGFLSSYIITLTRQLLHKKFYIPPEYEGTYIPYNNTFRNNPI